MPCASSDLFIVTNPGRPVFGLPAVGQSEGMPVSSIAKGGSFESAARVYSAELFRFAYWKVNDRGLAEDLVQDTLLRAWKAWDGLKDRQAEKGWLYSILRNEIARHYGRAQPQTDDSAELDELPDLSQTGAEKGAEMQSLLNALPEKYREPLLLQVLGGFSTAEIGAIMSLSEAAVMQRVSRARLALRKLAED